MIGDLVMLRGEQNPQVVQEILYDTVTIQCWPHRYDDISPIPLTSEILEANFEKKGANFGIFDDYFDFELHEYNDGTWLVTYHCCEMSLPDEQVMLFHVHQLQHFMHHCGIDKEITINN